MTDYTVKRLALILSIQAEIEAMKAANQNRISNKEALAYDDSSFYEQAEQLRELAYKHDEQL